MIGKIQNILLSINTKIFIRRIIMTVSLVTGGAGFIGSHIVDKLLELGHEVICYDNESAESNEDLIEVATVDVLKGLSEDVFLVTVVPSTVTEYVVASET